MIVQVVVKLRRHVVRFFTTKAINHVQEASEFVVQTCKSLPMPSMPRLQMLHLKMAVMGTRIVLDLVYYACQVKCTAMLLHIALPYFLETMRFAHLIL